MSKSTVKIAVISAALLATVTACGTPIKGTVVDKFHEDEYTHDVEYCTTDMDGRDRGELECEDVEETVPECWGLVIDVINDEDAQVCVERKLYDSLELGDHFDEEKQ